MAASPENSRELVSEIGEVELIRRFFMQDSATLSEGTVGIGDDCAVLNFHEEHRLLVTTDQLVERVHFLKEKNPARDIGYKSVAVNFSDIAAMGGQPVGVFLSLALPESTPAAWLEEFKDGLFELCKQYEVPLLGGDTTGSRQDIVINLTVLGKVSAGQLKLRSSAQNDDAVCVIGTLGDSAAGLQLLKSSQEYPLSEEYRQFLLERHLRPHPALDEGDWLGKQSAVHAMIDLSDGLSTDAGHIADSSQAGININLDGIPLSEAISAFSGERDQNPIDLALYGGEDYHLLCTIEKNSFSDISQRFSKQFNKPLYRVGSVTSKHQEVKYYRNGKPVSQTGSGFDHFNLSR